MKNRHNNIERTAVNLVNTIVTSDFNWIFREQNVSDYGVDAQIEIVEKGQPTHKLIGIQIKGGKSHLHGYRESRNNCTFYIDNIHYLYWISSAIPIIGIFNPENDILYWQKFDRSTITKTNSRWKCIVPKSNIFNKKCKDTLLKLTEEWISYKSIPKLYSNPLLETASYHEYYILIVQSLRIIHDCIYWHKMNIPIFVSKDAMKERDPEKLSPNDLFKFNKLNISIFLLNQRVKYEAVYLTKIANDHLLSYDLRLYSKYKQNKSNLGIENLKKSIFLLHRQIDEINELLLHELNNTKYPVIVSEELRNLHGTLNNIKLELDQIKRNYTLFLEYIT